jgi:hypothetical protein
MRYGRALLAGLGWAGTLGCVALCVLIFLSAYFAFDRNRPGVRPREGKAVRLPAVPDAKVPPVSLARPPGRLRGGGGGGGSGGTRRPSGPVSGRGTPPRTGTSPRAGTRPPQAPAGTGPPQADASPPAATVRPNPSAASGGAGGVAPPPQPTLGDTTRGAVHVVGTEVGRVSPPVGEVVDQTGDTVGDTVDSLIPPPPPALPPR